MATCRIRGGLRQLVRSSRIGAACRLIGGSRWRTAASWSPRHRASRRSTESGRRRPSTPARHRPPTEQRRQCDALGVPGVLVFVEQHHPVAVRSWAPTCGKLQASRAPRPSATRSPSLFGEHPLVQRIDQGHQPARSVCAASSRSNHWLGRALAGRAGGQGVHQQR
ncbi:putative ATP-dependent DNA helicase domain protein [Mycobacterium xenopi 3993]|nr:putative ATP-dependent DNA helicase domain protein [Mycobacterium xenopi 3993]